MVDSSSLLIQWQAKVQPSMPAQLAVDIANFQMFSHHTGFMKGQTIKRDQTLTAIVQVNSPQGQIQQRN